MATSAYDFFSSPLSSRGRGLGFIVPSSECRPSDQTDIDCVVKIGPLGRWSLAPKQSPDWDPTLGGRPRGVGGRPAPEPDSLLVRSRGFWTLPD